MRIVCACLAVLLLVAAGCQRKTIEGDWEGTLSALGTQLRLAFHITKNTGNAYTATLDSLDQNARGLPLELTNLPDGGIKLEAKTIGGVFEGKMSDDGSQISGNWQQSGMTFPLTLQRKTEAQKP